MPVTPEHVENATFSKVKRNGYSIEQVHRYLRTVADAMRELEARAEAAAHAPAPAAPEMDLSPAAPVAPAAPAATATDADLRAASEEMAKMLAELHSSIGERQRAAEADAATIRADAEREAAAIVSAASEEADGVRQQADRILADAEHHAELVRSDGEQRVRERCADTLRVARSELQDLLRKKHEILAAMRAAKVSIADAEDALGDTSLAPEALSDSLVSETIIDIRDEADDTPPPPVEHPSGNGVSFFTPPDAD